MAPPWTSLTWLVAVVGLVSAVAGVEVLEASGRSVVQTKYDGAAKKQELDYKVRGRQEAQPNFYYQPISPNKTAPKPPPPFKPSSSDTSRGSLPWRYGSSDSGLSHRGGLSGSADSSSGGSPNEDSYLSRPSDTREGFSSKLHDYPDGSRQRESRLEDGATSSRSSRLASSGDFSSDLSDGPKLASSTFSSSKSPRSSRLASGSDFSKTFSGSDDSHDDFSSGLTGFSKGFSAIPTSSSKLSSGFSSDFPRGSSSGSSSSSSDFPRGSNSGSSLSSSSSSGDGFLSGFFPSLSPFGSKDSSPFPSKSPFADESDGVSPFVRTPPSTLTLLATSSSFVDGYDDHGDAPSSSSSSGSLREEDAGPDRPPTYDSDEYRGDADSGGRYERGYLHTREFRDTKAVGAPATTAPRPPPRSQRIRSTSSGGRYKQPRKRQHKTLAEAKQPLRNYSEQQHLTPYSDHRNNHTDYKYYEDHDANDTHVEHHYRHVVSTHNYYNASDNNASTATPYSKDAAYDALRIAKKHNYNVDHVYNDGRYIPIVHKQEDSENLSEGNFPDGPHVKHHYYNNEYVHDHRNKSTGPTVRHHYHNKDVKVFYHDHRNKTGGKYSSYSPSKYSSSSTYGPDYHGSESSSSEGYASSSSSSESPVVKHHHHVKEFHYDEKGRLIDPKKYNYTDMYTSSNYTKYDDEQSSGEASDGDGRDESHDSYSEPSGDGRHTGDEDEGKQDEVDDRRQQKPSSYQDDHATKSYYYNSNHHNHYSGRNRETTHGASRPSAARYEPEADYLTSVPLPQSHGAASAAAFRPGKGAVGYQVHHRDFGDHSFSSKEVNFEDGFSFRKEKRGGPSSYLETYTSPSGASGYFSSFRSSRDGGDDTGSRLRGLGGPGYRSGLVTRDVEAVTALAGSGKRPPLPLGSPAPGVSALAGLGHAARVFPDHTRSLVSRGNIGYILVDPLGELPTIRIHASLVNSAQHAAAPSAPYPRYAPAPSLAPNPGFAHGLSHGLAHHSLGPAAPTRASFFSTSDPFHPAVAPVTALRRVDRDPSPSPLSVPSLPPSPTPTVPTTTSPPTTAFEPDTTTTS